MDIRGNVWLMPGGCPVCGLNEDRRTSNSLMMCLRTFASSALLISVVLSFTHATLTTCHLVSNRKTLAAQELKHLFSVNKIKIITLVVEEFRRFEEARDFSDAILYAV